ncbi:SMP-30/gluconolactonase/LRE family protein [Stakelama sp. CBK3Z-3]|uniref:SMP-30/gluconolactonase/LRE family protein n=1 Tax=Stakelama flava TaxID=2860338 RepID=A0ABS6XQ24_9SPHN|nr:SMP-30/gluconolactonase/LRE family protein [Stakelama flava]MBW4332327.1 SMP-30/gluconolactonase/LRE family protein [Stakelama flava]
MNGEAAMTGPRQLELTRFAEGFLIPEGLRWRDGRLWMSDLMDGKVFRVDRDGSKTQLADFPALVSGLGFLPDGTLIAASMEDRKVYRIIDGRLELFADLSDFATGSLNELITDGSGTTYVGNFGYDYMGGAEPRPTHLHLISPDGDISEGPGSLIFPNGMVLVDGGRTLVVAETWNKRLTAFDRSADGRLSNARPYADLGERTPDGLCVDAEDGIWIASFETGEFLRLAVNGEITHEIRLPGHIAFACALGGDDGKTLFAGAYDGSVEQIFEREFRGFVSTARVDVAAAALI